MGADGSPSQCALLQLRHPLRLLKSPLGGCAQKPVLEAVECIHKERHRRSSARVSDPKRFAMNAARQAQPPAKKD